MEPLESGLIYDEGFPEILLFATQLHMISYKMPMKKKESFTTRHHQSLTFKRKLPCTKPHHDQRAQVYLSRDATDINSGNRIG
jgi:hypothetical protein